MNELPDLDRLGHAEKNDLIRALFAQVQALTLIVLCHKSRLTLSRPQHGH